MYSEMHLRFTGSARKVNVKLAGILQVAGRVVDSGADFRAALAGQVFLGEPEGLGRRMEHPGLGVSAGVDQVRAGSGPERAVPVTAEALEDPGSEVELEDLDLAEDLEVEDLAVASGPADPSFQSYRTTTSRTPETAVTATGDFLYLPHHRLFLFVAVGPRHDSRTRSG